MNLSSVKIITISSFVGGLVGYLILHPASMFIHEYLIDHNIRSLDFISISFSIKHIEMAIFFTIGGIIFGFLQGLYNYKLNLLCEKIKVLSITDELTSLYNRRYLMDELEKEIERSKRYSRSLALIIVDIDKFKYNNDTYGHLYGDRILQLLAKFLIGTVRKIDFVARYGGDEFVIVMPEIEKSMANILAERLLKKLNQYPYKNQKHPMKTKIAISIGIASFPDDAKNIVELLHNADLALYKAKEKGGNRIINFDMDTKKDSR